MSDDVLTIEHIRRALLIERVTPLPSRPVFVVPKFLVEPMRKEFGSAVEVIEQEQIYLPPT